MEKTSILKDSPITSSGNTIGSVTELQSKSITNLLDQIKKLEFRIECLEDRQILLARSNDELQGLKGVIKEFLESLWKR